MFKLLLPSGDMIQAKRVSFFMYGVASVDKFDSQSLSEGIYKVKQEYSGKPINYINFNRSAVEPCIIADETEDVIGKDLVSVSFVPELYDFVCDSEGEVVISVVLDGAIGGESFDSLTLFTDVDIASSIQDDLLSGAVGDASMCNEVDGFDAESLLGDVIPFRDLI